MRIIHSNLLPILADINGMFEWNNSFSVGIGSVDAQHQNLFAIARELHSAMSSGQGKAALGKILDRLVQYTAAHFAHEERLMRLADYPGLETHKSEHEALTRRVLDLQREFAAGKTSISVHVLQFLRTWLQEHIQHSDMAYGPYMKQAKVA
jgi:hemerythrin-like metal-binding protein